MALPVIVVDHITLHKAQVRLTDQTIEPAFSTLLSAMELDIRNVSTQPQEQAKISFHANLDDRGRISSETLIKPLAQPMDMESTFSLNDYAIRILTPYTGKYTGRELQEGKMDLTLDYRIENNQLLAGHKILIQHFTFGKQVESKDALHLPFGLAVGLLEDSQGRIRISLPAKGNIQDPKFEYFHLIGQVAGNFFMKLVTKPFTFLASMLGEEDNGTEQLGTVRFPPGQTDLSKAEQQKLVLLIKGLKDRPKLHLNIPGSYDPQADWKSIQFQIFTRDYDELRKQSSRSDAKVYQQLYQRRFGMRALWALARKHKIQLGIYDDVKLNQEIKRQLIENAPADRSALTVLGQARSKIIYDFFIAHGLDAGHLSTSLSNPTQSSMGFVPLEFTLTSSEGPG